MVSLHVHSVYLFIRSEGRCKSWKLIKLFLWGYRPINKPSKPIGKMNLVYFTPPTERPLQARSCKGGTCACFWSCLMNSALIHVDWWRCLDSVGNKFFHVSLWSYGSRFVLVYVLALPYILIILLMLRCYDFSTLQSVHSVTVLRLSCLSLRL